MSRITKHLGDCNYCFSSFYFSLIFSKFIPQISAFILEQVLFSLIHCKLRGYQNETRHETKYSAQKGEGKVLAKANDVIERFDTNRTIFKYLKCKLKQFFSLPT